MELFSQRNKIKTNIVGPEEMPVSLKNRLINIISEKIEEDRNKNEIIKSIWSDFLKNDISELNGFTSYR